MDFRPELIVSRKTEKAQRKSGMARIPLPTIFLLMATAAAGCSLSKQSVEQKESPVLRLNGSAFGTTWSLIVTSPPAELNQAALQTQIDSVLQRIDKQISTYRPDSEISQFNASQSTDWFAVSPEIAKLVEQSGRLSEITNGAFDVTVNPLVKLWKFGPSRKTTATLEIPSAEAIKECMEKVGYRKLLTRHETPALKKSNPQLSIDLSSIGEGHALDSIGSLLEARGLKNYLVELGGEVRARGRGPRGTFWRAGIERPEHLGRDIECAVELQNSGLATSGNYRNFYVINGKRYAHIIDARTGHPVEHNLAAASVIATESAHAGILSTAMMALGPDDALALAKRENIAVLLLVRKDSTFEERTTPGFDKIRK